MTSVLSYGAIGDGITDDTFAINTGLVMESGGGELEFPAGDYKISAPLCYESGTRITGVSSGSVTIRNAINRVNDTVMLEPWSDGVEHVIISGIRFHQRSDVYDSNGDSLNSYAVSVNASNHVTIRDCYFTTIRTMAVWCDSVSAQPTRNLSLRNNVISDARGGGISLFGAVEGFVIKGNHVFGTGDDAIAVQSTASGRVDGGVIIGNVVRDCDERTSYGATPHGILVFGGKNVHVLDNDIERVFASGVQICEGGGWGVEDVVVEGNRVETAGSNNPGIATPAHGVFLLYADWVEVHGNNVSDSLDDDFHSTGSNNVYSDM